MKNKLFWILTGALMLILATTATASADTIVTGPHYITNTDVYWHITRIDATYETRLTVAGSGGVPSYESAADTPWASYASQITELKIENGITSLGQNCFRAMRNLYSADLGDTVQDILPNSFANCTALKYVYLPRDLDTLYEHAFYNCQALTNMTLPSSNGFYKIENGVMTDSDGKYIYWGGGITGDEYYIPSRVTNIAGSAFCVPMTTKIYVPDTVTGIATDAFRSDHVVCGVSGSAIEEYMTDPFIGGSLAESYNGMCGPTVFWKITTRPQRNPLTGRLETIRTLTLKGIGQTTAYYSASLVPWNDQIITINTIDISEGITGLGSHLFNGAALVTNMVLPDTIASLGNYCFNGCSVLQRINIPDGVVRIGSCTFADTRISSVDLPDGLLILGTYAYKNTPLTSVEIPASVTSLGANAFEGCASLQTITVADGNTAYTSENSVVYNKAKTNLIIYPQGKADTFFLVPETITDIGANCYGNANIEYVYIPETTETISSSAFSACDGLTIYGHSGSRAETFAGDNGYTFIAIDGTSGSGTHWHFDIEAKTLIFTGTGTVQGHLPTQTAPWEELYPLMEAIIINDGITSIGMNAFRDAENVGEVTIPWTLETVGMNAFYDADAITDVYYTGGKDDYENLQIPTSAGDAFINAEWHFAEQKIVQATLANGYVVVVTENIHDGKKVMIASYTDENIYLGMDYGEVENNRVFIRITQADADYIKAFIIDLETLNPVCNFSKSR